MTIQSSVQLDSVRAEKKGSRVVSQRGASSMKDEEECGCAGERCVFIIKALEIKPVGRDGKGRARMVDIPRFSGSAHGRAFTSVYVAIRQDSFYMPPVTLVEGLPSRWSGFGWFNGDWSPICLASIVYV